VRTVCAKSLRFVGNRWNFDFARTQRESSRCPNAALHSVTSTRGAHAFSEGRVFIAAEFDRRKFANGMLFMNATSQKQINTRTNQLKAKMTLQGYEELEPVPNKVYFPNSASRNTVAGGPTSVVSVCVPCYNEDSANLQRTIESLKSQVFEQQTRIEIVIIIDGTKQISESMKEYLGKEFCISLSDGDAANPFEELPDANTIITEPDKTEEMLGLALVVKRVNKRKTNSQMWWLGSHARDIKCDYAFATDCGTTFHPHCLANLVKRLQSDPQLGGVTGFQRGMSAEMQGDGSKEYRTDPLGFLLRQMQKFDFEKQDTCAKSLEDSLGFLTVLPGPCSLFRYSHLGSLEEGVMKEYFGLTSKETPQGGIVLGNVQLAEDRFPSPLLTFRSKEECRRLSITKPRSGHEREAVYYFEAEKPLSLLVKQRRRWINGTAAAAWWTLTSGWIQASDHSLAMKVASLLYLVVFLLVEVATRIGPAVIAASLYILLDEFSVAFAAVVSGLYIFLYAMFVICHTPRVVRVPKKESSGITEQWRNDTASSFIPGLFAMAFVANLITSILFAIGGVNMVWTQGFRGSPLGLQLSLIAILMPYVLSLLDGLARTNRPTLTSFWILVQTTPVFFASGLWFYVWFPAYASARISDLTWGNRPGSHDDAVQSDIAKTRARIGQVTSGTIVSINVAMSVAAVVRTWMGYWTLDWLLFAFLGVYVFLYLLNLADMIVRILGKAFRFIFCCSSRRAPEDDYKIDESKTMKVDVSTDGEDDDAESGYCGSAPTDSPADRTL